MERDEREEREDGEKEEREEREEREDGEKEEREDRGKPSGSPGSMAERSVEPVWRERLGRGRDYWIWTSSETDPSLALVRKSLHPRRSMLSSSEELEPTYLRTSIALWVDRGSQETRYSLLRSIV